MHLKLAEALGKMHTLGWGLLRGWWWPVGPKLVFNQVAAPVQEIMDAFQPLASMAKPIYEFAHCLSMVKQDGNTTQEACAKLRHCDSTAVAHGFWTGWVPTACQDSAFVLTGHSQKATIYSTADCTVTPQDWKINFNKKVGHWTGEAFICT
jgi:hypothetical protein